MLHPIEVVQLQPGDSIAIKTHHDTIYVQREAQQWVISKVPQLQPTCTLEPGLHIQHAAIDGEVSESLRWTSGEQESTLRILPRMADKNLLLRAPYPLSIPSGRKPTFYVSLPLMYQLYIGTSKTPVYEFFVESLPHTWFGQNTRRGELCYEVSGSLALDADSLPNVPHRVAMQIRFCNRDSEHLQLEKINIPAQFLPIYRVDQKHFWTLPLTITNEKLTDELNLHYGKSVPCRYEQLQLVSEPRLRSDARSFMRAIEAIIG
jgi:hypothetical protein